METFPKEMAAVRDAGHEMFVTTHSSARSVDIPSLADFTGTPMRYTQYAMNLLELMSGASESDYDVA